MTDPTDTAPRTFGSRFAEVWKLLQAYLSDLDPDELEQLESADLDETLRLLRAQPALGMAPGLTEARSQSPEALAAAIVRDRLAVLEQALGSDDGVPWGAQLLSALRERGFPLSAFRYATIQTLKAADRSEAVELMRKHTRSGVGAKASWWTGKSVTQVADEIVRAWQYRQLMIAAVWF